MALASLWHAPSSLQHPPTNASPSQNIHHFLAKCTPEGGSNPLHMLFMTFLPATVSAGDERPRQQAVAVFSAHCTRHHLRGDGNAERWRSRLGRQGAAPAVPQCQHHHSGQFHAADRHPGQRGERRSWAAVLLCAGQRQAQARLPTFHMSSLDLILPLNCVHLLKAVLMRRCIAAIHVLYQPKQLC